MQDSYNKIARILRVSPELLLNLDQKMSVISGQDGVIDDIAQQNDILVSRTLMELGLTKESSAEEVYDALIRQIIHLDRHLFEALGKPDLEKMSVACGKLCEMAFRVFTPPKGLFIKKEKVVELLEKYRPGSLLDHFGYATVKELIEKEGFASTVSSLRFAQSNEWMHKFFDEAYSALTPDDFEERDVELVVLDSKWLTVVEKFLEKKYHNISHLKEYGIIFVIPLKVDTAGETLRMFTLILHYLHEVPFYSGLFKKFMSDENFIEKFKSLLRGDVSDSPLPDGGKIAWRVVQRYLAKDDENDFRLLEPHVNPEADHWFRTEGDLGRLSRMLGNNEGRFNLGYWTGLDFVGDFFKDKNGEDKLVSFALIDLIMSVVKKSQVKYLYHQQEALWNKIFSEYVGRERMNGLIEENIITGFIEL
ncbi:MAG: hypothetical protein A2651_01115 [Candidatus Yanofskybacteria bacterium RIFCSPHIGHO2_01_FULL_42_12]|uniref:Glycosidase related protein n=1 Tax=Candidatus Yanofskybacteria bacterium RIFCSPLOWO2_01_FULL_42_49 TaxID=1802694 RepID=A0A1F8GBJ0_9BACT|nr:MAG: hypothetical protein A2651_01115 [Candidatus Yanofskybacteria bacterium RIFCSPHIGHO2_01_FULL_42_12]OGN22651.1 MAG: hypothetical protein A2918_00935 [Candidatus Yanofskybacteria bacterium RIFCSPLOWO2_01_FULL_42_49]